MGEVVSTIVGVVTISVTILGGLYLFYRMMVIK